MTNQDSLLVNINRFCDYLAILVDNGIDIDATKFQDTPGVKMNLQDAGAYKRAADRAEAMLIELGIAV